nr:putative ribonuclease H-like domain-containing protein [Tanacetum cinerariifolium]
ELLKVDVAPLVPKLRKNRTAHTDYIRHTKKEAALLREIVERVNLVSSTSGSLSQYNTKHNRIWQTQKKAKKNKIKDHLRTVKFNLNKESDVDSKATSSVINSVTNVNSDLKCSSCNGYLLSDNHDACVVAYKNSVNASKKSKSVKTPIQRKVWKPTGRIFTLVGNVCPLTGIATPTIVPPREPIPIINRTDKPVVTLVVQIVLWYLDSGCSKHMTEDRSQLVNFIQKFLGTVKFAFRQHTCFIHNLDEVDLLTGSRENNLYTLSIQDMMASSPKYILVIMDDYSRFTWVKFLRSKDETPDFIIKFLKMIQLRLKVLVRRIRTNNGTEFVNHTLRDYYEEVGISYETSVARSPQQNGVVERRNRTLIESARTMLIYAQAPLFLWTEAMATACFTQNHSIIHLRHGKTPYELLHSKLPDLSFFHVFGALCYLTNDSENLGVVNQAPEAIAPIVDVIPSVNADSNSLPSSTTVEQDAPSMSNSSKSTETQSSVIPQDDGDDNLDMEIAHIGNDSLFGTYKEALTQSCWIEAMQEELNEFERLEEEGIDFEESFAPVARLEAIRIFL